MAKKEKSIYEMAGSLTRKMAKELSPEDRLFVCDILEFTKS